MKIGIVCYPTFGGSGVVATELGIELSKKGHEIHFITYSQPVRLDALSKNLHYHVTSFLVCDAVYRLFFVVHLELNVFDVTPGESEARVKLRNVFLRSPQHVLVANGSIFRLNHALLYSEERTQRNEVPQIVKYGGSGQNPSIFALEGTDALVRLRLGVANFVSLVENYAIPAIFVKQSVLFEVFPVHDTTVGGNDNVGCEWHILPFPHLHTKLRRELVQLRYPLADDTTRNDNEGAFDGVTKHRAGHLNRLAQSHFVAQKSTEGS